MSGRQSLALRWGEQTLTVVAPRRETWPPGADGRTSLRLTPSEGIEVQVGGARLEPVDGRWELRRPLLHQDTVVDVYLEGPAAATLRTLPRPATAELVHASRSVQHHRLDLGGSVGDVTWLWTTPRGPVRVGLEVFPDAVDYRRHYSAIRGELLAVAPRLTLSLAGDAGAPAGPSGGSPAAELDWLEHVRRERERLRLGMLHLLPRLRGELRRAVVVAPSDRLRGARPVARRDQRLLGPGQRPRLLAVEEVAPTRQTPLNGHLRAEVDALARAADAVLAQPWSSALDADVRASVLDLASAAAGWRRDLADVAPSRAPAGLGPRLRDPRYAVVLSALRRIRQALEPEASTRLVGVKDLPSLYECWVFLTVVDRLTRIFPTTVARGPSPVQRVGGELVLAGGRGSQVTLADPQGRSVTCRYARRSARAGTAEPVPVIEVAGEGRLLLVDARYRSAPQPGGPVARPVVGPRQSDVEALHRHRDALVSAQPPARRRVVGGLVAFPSAETRRYRAHRSWRSWPALWTGAVPLLPGAVDLLDEALGQFFAAAHGAEGVSA